MVLGLRNTDDWSKAYFRTLFKSALWWCLVTFVFDLGEPWFQLPGVLNASCPFEGAARCLKLVEESLETRLDLRVELGNPGKEIALFLRDGL